MHHGDVTFAHREGAGDQVVGGHTLQDGGGGDLQAYLVRNRDDPVRRQHDLLGVAAARPGPGHPVTDGRGGYVLPDGSDRAPPSAPGTKGGSVR